MPPESLVEIRLYRAGDGQAINDLFNQVFQTQRPLPHWRWKFLESHTAEPLIIVAEEEGRIVGVYPSIGVRFQVADRAVLARQAVDVGVLPKYRRGGTQRALYAALAARMQETGWSFLFGFPNDGHHRVGKRMLGYRDLCVLPILTQRLNFRLALKRRLDFRPLERVVALLSNWGYRLYHQFRRRALPGELQVEVVNEFDPSFDDFWLGMSKQYAILAVRDAAYLRWRYRTNPHGNFRIFRALIDGRMTGYLISTVVESGAERSCYIFDLLVTDDAAARALLRRATKEAVAAGLDNIKIGMLEHVRLAEILSEEGFTRHAESRLVTYVLYDASLEDCAFSDARRWFLTLGDTDFLG